MNTSAAGAASVSLSASKSGYATASAVHNFTVNPPNVAPLVTGLSNVTGTNGGRAVAGVPHFHWLCRPAPCYVVRLEFTPETRTPR